MYNDIISFIQSTFGTREFIPLHEPQFIGREREFILDCLDSTYVSSVGKYVDLFESKITEYTGSKYAIATSNGTAALHMAMVLAGVQKDDLVITQPLTFVATCNAIKYIGASPVFIDVDLKTMGMSPDALLNFINSKCFQDNDGNTIFKETNQRIAGCIPMHTFGFPAEIDTIVGICKKSNIPIVEDAAESLGSFYKNQHTGTFGDLGTLSFNGNKTITCGGGGMILTNNETLAAKAKHLTTTAKIPHKWDYEHDEIGYNYRLPNLNAALGCAQIEKLEFFIKKKRELAAKYKDFFQSNDVKYMSETEHSYANYWLNAIILKDLKERNKFLQLSNDQNVMTRPIWKLMYKLKMFSNSFRFETPNAEYLEQRVVNIPSSVILNV